MAGMSDILKRHGDDSLVIIFLRNVLSVLLKEISEVFSQDLGIGLYSGDFDGVFSPSVFFLEFGMNVVRD